VRLKTNSIDGWDVFASLAIRNIKQERFIFPLLAACSYFMLQIPFEYIDFFKITKESQKLLSGTSFGFKASLFLLIQVSCVVLFSQ
jgi:hypothetical protein